MCLAPKPPSMPLPPPAAAPAPTNMSPIPAIVPGAGGGASGQQLSLAAFQAGPGRTSPTITRQVQRFGESVRLTGKQALTIPGGR